jgi:hypothetical protein
MVRGGEANNRLLRHHAEFPDSVRRDCSYENFFTLHETAASFEFETNLPPTGSGTVHLL